MKNCVLLNSVQEFIEIEAWLLLTSYLRNQFLYYSIAAGVQMFEKCDSSSRQK